MVAFVGRPTARPRYWKTSDFRIQSEEFQNKHFAFRLVIRKLPFRWRLILDRKVKRIRQRPRITIIWALNEGP